MKKVSLEDNKDLKVLSFQPFSIYGTGGGCRILRRIYEGHEYQISSLVIDTFFSAPKAGNIPETIIPVYPQVKPWMKWKLRNLVIWLQKNTFKSVNIKRIQKTAADIPHNVIHVINHGSFSSSLCEGSDFSKKKLWVSFHDHFLTSGSSFNDAKKLWSLADRRFVISHEMGTEYNRLFGSKEFEIITDGVSEDEISQPSKNNAPPLIIYFAGLLHIDYLPLFKVLGDALAELVKKGVSVKLVLRGTQQVEFLNNRNFEVEYRPISLDSTELKTELDSAVILYLPIKFSVPDFYLYSLSTKMVGYLGGSGSILYHGPGDSAACNLLQNTKSAICCKSLDVNELLSSFSALLDPECKVSDSAKILAQNQFNLDKIRQRIWQSDNK